MLFCSSSGNSLGGRFGRPRPNIRPKPLVCTPVSASAVFAASAAASKSRPYSTASSGNLCSQAASISCDERTSVHAPRNAPRKLVSSNPSSWPPWLYKGMPSDLANRRTQYPWKSFSAAATSAGVCAPRAWIIQLSASGSKPTRGAPTRSCGGMLISPKRLASESIGSPSPKDRARISRHSASCPGFGHPSTTRSNPIDALPLRPPTPHLRRTDLSPAHARRSTSARAPVRKPSRRPSARASV